jgi:ATP-binding cassette subfamily B multidrug efflux pump
MLRLARFLKPFRKEVILGPIFKLIEAIFELIVPLVMAKVIDVGVATGDGGYVLRMGGLMLLLGLVGLACALTCQYFAAKASQGFGTRVRNALFDHINALGYEELDRLGTSSLITRVTNDVNQLQVAVAMLIRLAIRAPFLAIGAIVMAMLLDLKLSVVFLVTAPLIVLILYAVMSRSIPFYRLIQRKLDRVALITRENLAGVRVVRAFSKQGREAARFEAVSDDLAETAVRVGKISALLNPLTYLTINLAVVALLWFGGLRVNVGGFTQGQLIAFTNYMSQILLALVVVANLVVIFTKAAASAARVVEVFDTQPAVTEAEATPGLAPTPGAPRVAFQDVSFAYGGQGRGALERLSFAIQPGQTVGVIGGTGAGKSTLAQLVARAYDPTSGQVLLDGHPLPQYPLDELHRRVGVVPQRAVLFTGTIASNLRWGNPDAPDEALWQALSIAQAADFVRDLPGGLESPVAQGGQNFSGGQRQRLTIARALVQQPDILILDDSASALDFATDAALRQALRRETRGMTVLLISQRAASLQHADQILVLDDGRLVGVGSHGDLFQHCPVYREICLSQMDAQEAQA